MVPTVNVFDRERNNDYICLATVKYIESFDMCCIKILIQGIVLNFFLTSFILFVAEQLGAFESICSQMLQDVQERLVYRTYIYIRHEILHYNPAQGDLAYPEKLQMMEVSRQRETW